MTFISANCDSQNVNSKNISQFTRISRNVTCHRNYKLYEVTYAKEAISLCPDIIWLTY